MSVMAKDYQITEADIENMIAYIKTVDPDNATPEMAIQILETEYAKNHMMSHDNPDVLEAIYTDFKKNIKS